MGGYTQRVRDSILPLSVAGTLPAAFGEWSFTENTVDHEQPIETCELCGRQDLRYHFEIANQYTDETLWVGSHCILQFDVAVLENGRRLSPMEAKRHLTKLTQQMQLESCIRTLEQLAAKESNPILSGALDYYRKNKKLTPKICCRRFLEAPIFQRRSSPIVLSDRASSHSARRGSSTYADLARPPILERVDDGAASQGC